MELATTVADEVREWLTIAERAGLVENGDSIRTPHAKSYDAESVVNAGPRSIGTLWFATPKPMRLLADPRLRVSDEDAAPGAAHAVRTECDTTAAATAEVVLTSRS